MRRFPSIKDNCEFRQIYESGRTRADRNLVLYLCFRPAGDSRIGISASKKIGNSVVRHRVTRVLREIFRLHRHAFTSPCDLIFVVRKDGAKQDYCTLEASFLKLCRAQGILEEARC